VDDTDPPRTNNGPTRSITPYNSKRLAIRY
jgi:hypothetical protein